MMTEQPTELRRDPRTWAALILAVVAFAGSFDHVRQTVSDHGQVGWLSWAIAAMPELMVLLTVYSVKQRQATAWTWVTGGSAVLFTLAANLAQAEPSPWGYVAAGWPAWAAVSAVTLLPSHAKPQATRKPARQTPTTVGMAPANSKSAPRGLELASVTPRRPRATVGGGGDVVANPVATKLAEHRAAGKTRPEATAEVVKETGLSLRTVQRHAEKVWGEAA